MRPVSKVAAPGSSASDMNFSLIVMGALRINFPDALGDGKASRGSLSSRFTHWDICNTIRNSILKATNLGDDADTTAAICGQLAGAYYGESGIPAAWLDKLCMREMMRIWPIDLYNAVGPETNQSVHGNSFACKHFVVR